MADTIHVGDTPFLQYTVYDGSDKVNITDDPPSAIALRLNAPSGGTSATVVGVTVSGDDYAVGYQTGTGTFDWAGQWRISVRITWAGGRRFESEVDVFEVHESEFP